jgi:hypothetical protein
MACRRSIMATFQCAAGVKITMTTKKGRHVDAPRLKVVPSLLGPPRSQDFQNEVNRVADSSE